MSLLALRVPRRPWSRWPAWQLLLWPCALALCLSAAAEARKHKKRRRPVPVPVPVTMPVTMIDSGQRSEAPGATPAGGAAPAPGQAEVMPNVVLPPDPAPAAPVAPAATEDVPRKRRTRAARPAPEKPAPAAVEIEPDAADKPADKPASAPAAPPAAAAGTAEVKAGRFMANLRTGGAINASDYVSQFALAPEFGLALTPDRAAYLIFPLAFQFGGDFTTIQLPVGFQYDIPLKVVPGLYLTPRVSLGYSAMILNLGLGRSTSFSAGVFIPEFGAKYVFRRRWNFGGEIFSLPIYFSSNSFAVSGGSVAVQYRLLFYAGANF